MECPKEEDIILYRYNRLPFWKKILYRQHIKKCKRCAAVLENIYKDDELIAEMQNSINVFQNLQEKSSK
jgi:hypothetical protein